MADRERRLKSLLLAAGLGTRLHPLTSSIPKCLISIAGCPLLDVWVEKLIECGVREARVNTHSLAMPCAHVAQINTEGRLHLSEAYEPELLGSAGTVTANVDLADDADEVLVIYADNFSDIDLRPLIAFHRQHGDPLTMVLFRRQTHLLAELSSSTRREGSSPSSRSRKYRQAILRMQGSMLLTLQRIEKSPK